jgi:Ser/Thr protein kinase RdoA (MazF antagonist)
VRALAAAYELIDARVVDEFKSKRNYVFKLDCRGESVVARRLRPRTGLKARLAAQHTFVAYLAGSGFPAIPPLSTADGRTFATIGGDVYDVYPFVEGERAKPPGKAHVALAARALSTFHKLTHGYNRAGMNRPDLREQFFRRVGRFGSLATAVPLTEANSDLSANVNYLKSALIETEQRVRELNYEKLPRVIVHGDFHSGNLLFRSNQLVAVLDFDSSRPDARAADVAVALLKLTRSEAGLDPQLLSGFVSAYGGVTFWQEAEWRALPLLIETYVALRAVRRLRHLLEAGSRDRRSAEQGFTEFVDRLRWLRTSREWRAIVGAPAG